MRGVDTTSDAPHPLQVSRFPRGKDAFACTSLSISLHAPFHACRRQRMHSHSHFSTSYTFHGLDDVPGDACGHGRTLTALRLLRVMTSTCSGAMSQNWWSMSGSPTAATIEAGALAAHRSRKSVPHLRVSQALNRCWACRLATVYHGHHGGKHNGQALQPTAHVPNAVCRGKHRQVTDILQQHRPCVCLSTKCVICYKLWQRQKDKWRCDGSYEKPGLLSQAGVGRVLQAENKRRLSLAGRAPDIGQQRAVTVGCLEGARVLQANPCQHGN